MKKYFLASLAVVVVCAGVISFIYFSNDHSECELATEITYNENGEKVTTETHICKEKFNL
ncbi:hypothetical protein [uncultured Psychroserpens sp.]|uniref:hypothetical protein n=1 Tax=uncultured Psychroserpens sp. TaxID=255436 RepID=UPI00261A62D8|nr:hypothetical protein [uncultured Psychroserpens sp.]